MTSDFNPSTLTLDPNLGFWLYLPSPDFSSWFGFGPTLPWNSTCFLTCSLTLASGPFPRHRGDLPWLPMLQSLALPVLEAIMNSCKPHLSRSSSRAGNCIPCLHRNSHYLAVPDVSDGQAIPWLCIHPKSYFYKMRRKKILSYWAQHVGRAIELLFRDHLDLLCYQSLLKVDTSFRPLLSHWFLLLSLIQALLHSASLWTSVPISAASVKLWESPLEP